MQLINWNLLKNPFNWVIIFLMLVIFGMGADVVLSKFKGDE